MTYPKCETKEETTTVTKTLYKCYSPHPTANSIRVIWQTSRPFKVETTLEYAVELLREQQASYLARSRAELEAVKQELKDAEAAVIATENRFSTEYSIKDETK